MVAEAYQLPTKEGNPHWPMPAEYHGDPTRPAEDRGACHRCGCGSVNQYCDDCAERRKSDRLALCRGWYDPDKPGQLMRDPDVYVVANNFFVDTYLKPCNHCRHEYFRPDSKHKPRIQRMFTHPRSAMVAPRGVGKTVAVCLEKAPFIAVTRPYTDILLGSETGDMTIAKIKKIRARIESNGLLYADFGQTWPAGSVSSKDWNNKILDFLNGSSITGSSIDSATRGRHPLVGLIDDPEGKRSKSKKWRDQFMEWLFRDYLNQFDDKGTHVMWIGTILKIDSCLYRAVKNLDKENRFIGWERAILKMIYEDPPGSGTMVSAWPEKLTVGEFERKKRGAKDEDGSVTPIGFAAVQAEFQGDPVPPGSRMFERDIRKHGYVLSRGADGKKIIYDPLCREVHDFDQMFQECYKHEAVDVCDNEGNSDEGAVVVAMVDPDGCIWFIDAWSAACYSDTVTLRAFRMGHDWKCSLMGFESVVLGRRIYREAQKLRRERMSEGFHVPKMVPLSHDGIAKECRIERMRPDFDSGLLKFPLFVEIDGYEPIKQKNRAALERLVEQFDKMTDEPMEGNDDLIDAAEELHRISNRKPKRTFRKSEGRRIIEGWEAKGVQVDPMQTDPENWTERMQKEFDRRVKPSVTKEVAYVDAFE